MSKKSKSDTALTNLINLLKNDKNLKTKLVEVLINEGQGEVRKGRGRPKKTEPRAIEAPVEIKRGRGRPRKIYDDEDYRRPWIPHENLIQTPAVKLDFLEPPTLDFSKMMINLKKYSPSLQAKDFVAKSFIHRVLKNRDEMIDSLKGPKTNLREILRKEKKSVFSVVNFLVAMGFDLVDYTLDLSQDMTKASNYRNQLQYITLIHPNSKAFARDSKGVPAVMINFVGEGDGAVFAKWVTHFEDSQFSMPFPESPEVTIVPINSKKSFDEVLYKPIQNLIEVFTSFALDFEKIRVEKLSKEELSKAKFIVLSDILDPVMINGFDIMWPNSEENNLFDGKNVFPSETTLYEAMANIFYIFFAKKGSRGEPRKDRIYYYGIPEGASSHKASRKEAVIKKIAVPINFNKKTVLTYFANNHLVSKKISNFLESHQGSFFGNDP